MTVLHVLPTRETRYGGPIRVAENFTKALAPLGVKSEIFPHVDHPRRGRWFLIGIGELVQLHRAILKSDVVHIHGLWTFVGLATAIFCKLLGKRYFISPHGMLGKWQLDRGKLKKLLYLKLIEGPVLKSSHAIIVTHDEELQEVRSVVNHRVQMVQNCVEFSEKRSERGSRGSGSLNLLSMSRLHPKKGVDLLIDAIAMLPVTYRRQIKLFIAGEKAGNYYQSLVEQVAGNDLSETVSFIGEIYNVEKEKQFECTDIFVLFSYQEGDPVAVKEALAAGIFVIKSEHCHFREWDALKISKTLPLSHKVLADFIISILDGDYQIPDSEYIQSEAEKIFSTVNVGKNLQRVYFLE